MKQYVKVNNPEQMRRLLELYKTFSWRASVSGLNHQIKNEGIYPVVVGHGDDYSWYTNDHGNDGKVYLSVDNVLNMHNTLSYEKTIYINHYPRSGFNSGFSVHQLEQLNDDRELSDTSIGFTFIEKSNTQSMTLVGQGHQNWNHYECEIKSFKKRNISTIKSYTEVGGPKFSLGKRMGNELHQYCWEIVILLPGSYESHKNSNLVESSIRVTDYEKTNPNTGCCQTGDFSVNPNLKHSNYIYYTLL